MSVDFGKRGKKALVYRDLAELTILVVGKRFQLPEQCITTSLAVYLNQGVLDRESENGFVVLSPDTFELKETLAGLGTKHAFFVSYQPD